MDVIKLDAKARTPGKGPSRAARRNHEVPCILYGHSQEPVAFQVGELDLRPLIYTDEFHRVEVTVEGSSYDCILKKVDFHPVSDRPFHADFQVLQAGEEITLTIPLQFAGTPAGVRSGGRTQVFMHELEITCLPKDIPDHIELNVVDLEIGQSLNLGDVETEAVKFSLPLDTTLFAVLAPRAEEEELEDEGLEMAEEGAEEETEDEESED